MNDLPIDADACASGKSSVTEEGGTGVVLFDIGTDQMIQLLRRNARTDSLPRNEERLTRDPPRFSHDTELLGILQQNHTQIPSAACTSAVVSSTFSCPSTIRRTPFAP